MNTIARYLRIVIAALLSTAAVCVPTTAPAVPHWGQRKPWVLVAARALH